MCACCEHLYYTTPSLIGTSVDCFLGWRPPLGGILSCYMIKEDIGNHNPACPISALPSHCNLIPQICAELVCSNTSSWCHEMMKDSICVRNSLEQSDWRRLGGSIQRRKTSIQDFSFFHLSLITIFGSLTPQDLVWPLARPGLFANNIDA